MRCARGLSDASVQETSLCDSGPVLVAALHRALLPQGRAGLSPNANHSPILPAGCCQGLASAVANKLASGLAQQEGGLNRIGRW